jgi:SAM-dependent methyltransferase
VISNGWPRRPNVSRVYDNLLGGKDNYEDDRCFAEHLLAVVPDAQAAARVNRHFLARALRFAVAEVGVRQVIDIGTGLPAVCDPGQVARELAPATRVVYADNDPVVVSHARALLCGDPGVCAIQGDLRDPHGILGHPELRALIDLREPVVILLTAVLHFIPDEDQPYPLVDAVKAAMAPGSVVVISHATTDDLSPDAVKQVQELYAQATAPAVPRSREEIARFFDGLELVRPGIVDAACWRAGPLPARPGRALLLGGMARKR